ncbi:MAG: hypothetical protein QOF51_255 [Chloroflexota bacterium]|nr:hypothetical protein [Chloroflexota bacterium]
MEAPIPGQHVRGVGELSLMMLQAGRQLRGVGRVAREHLIAADEPALDLIEHELRAELGGPIQLPPPDHRRRRLEQAHHLLVRRNGFPAEDAPLCLAHHPLEERREVLQPRPEPRRLGLGAVVQELRDSFSSPQAGSRHRKQAPVVARAPCGGFLAQSTRGFEDRVRQAFGGPGPIAEQLTRPLGGLRGEAASPMDDPTEDAHAIGQEGAVGGMVDVRRDHRGVHPELPPPG